MQQQVRQYIIFKKQSLPQQKRILLDSNRYPHFSQTKFMCMIIYCLFQIQTAAIEHYYNLTGQILMKSPKQMYSIMRTKRINEIPTLTFSFNNKQDLRSIITDYVLHHIEEESKGVPFRRFKSKLVKYPNINLKVNVNKEEREITIQFISFLSKYIEIERKNIYRQGTIEPLVVDILNFIDEIQDKTKGVTFQIDPLANSKKLEDEVLNLIIQKHHKDKQKKCFSMDIDEYKRKIRAKHAKISYIDIEDQLKKKQKQFLLQISDLGTLDIRFDSSTQEKMIIPNPTNNISDRLNALIQSGQIFENPDKVQQLKRQKLIDFYKSSEVQYLSLQTSINDIHEFDNKNFTKECSKMLKDWIVDISISERYYQMKYNKNEKKRKAVTIDLDEKKLEAGLF